MEMAREYFSQRKAGGRATLDLDTFKPLFFAVYSDFTSRDYFTEAIGYECVDAGFIPGSMGEQPDVYALMHLEKDGLWPPDKDRPYDADDLFDLMEFLYDLVSKPLEG